MSLKPKAMSISELLSQILSDTVEFEVEKHFEFIDICKNEFLFRFYIHQG